jgi:hypothetical protein
VEQEQLHMAESGRKNVPVYRGTIDDPLGVLHALVENESIADDELAVSLRHALRSEGVRIEGLELSTLLGQVKLRGRAATPDNSRMAEPLARNFPGVHSVANALEVDQPT